MMTWKPQQCSASCSNNIILATAVIVLLFTQVYLATAAATVFNYGETSETVNGTDGRIRGARNRQGKDFVLGGLIPIHTDKDGRQCGAVRQERGLERMEAMLFAIDKINSDPNLLPQLSLGYDIRDTCNSENIGLDESIDLIITGSQLDIESCQSAATVMDTNTSNDVQYAQPSPTLGIVGAAGSRVSVPVASLTRLFRTPQVSYASSSSILSNRDRYSFFYRTIPPDNLQARAMVDILLRFEWTFVSTIFSINPYGQPGIDAFHNLARETGICIDLNAGVDSEYSIKDYDTLVDRLIKSKANVVVIFAAQGIAENILTRISTTEAKERFVFIASDAWARSINVVHKVNATAAGLFGIVPFTEHVEEFHEYFSNLTIDSNVRNPWFREFYSAFANCSLDNMNSTLPPCVMSVNVTRLPRYQQGNFIPLVFDAVYTFALALDNFLDENCDHNNFTWYRNNRTCAGQTRELNGTSLLEYIARLKEANPVTGNNLLFDELGNVESLYEILNYQAKPVGNGFEYFFQRVGTWDSSVTNDSNLEALNLSIARPQFGVDTSLHRIINEAIVSQCTQCRPGQRRRVGQSDCCGVCDPCATNTYSNTTTATECSLCPNDTWGNNPAEGSTECVPIPRSFLSYSHPYSVIIIIVATLGLLIVLTTVTIFFIYWTTPIIKSSGREQMMLLLIGIASSFLLAFFFVAPPHPALCAIQRIGLWFSFSLMFGSLMVKIVRVARIFLRNKDLARPRFIEPIYQVLFTFSIVIVQLAIVLISLLVVNPNISSSLRFNADMPNELPQIVITCIPENVIILVLSVGYETVIIMVATILGGLSFKYPANFNEAKYIAFCLFALLVIWIAFIITYFATQSTQEFQNIAVSLAVVMSGYAVLICIFGPKLFIVLLQPHKNTTKNIEPSSTGLILTNTTGIPKGNVDSMDKSNQKLHNQDTVDPSDTKNGLSTHKYGDSQKVNTELSPGETSKV